MPFFRLSGASFPAWAHYEQALLCELRNFHAIVNGQQNNYTYGHLFNISYSACNKTIDCACVILDVT